MANGQGFRYGQNPLLDGPRKFQQRAVMGNHNHRPIPLEIEEIAKQWGIVLELDNLNVSRWNRQEQLEYIATRILTEDRKRYFEKNRTWPNDYLSEDQYKRRLLHEVYSMFTGREIEELPHEWGIFSRVWPDYQQWRGLGHDEMYREFMS